MDSLCGYQFQPTFNELCGKLPDYMLNSSDGSLNESIYLTNDTTQLTKDIIILSTENYNIAINIKNGNYVQANKGNNTEFKLVKSHIELVHNDYCYASYNKDLKQRKFMDGIKDVLETMIEYRLVMIIALILIILICFMVYLSASIYTETNSMLYSLLGESK